MKPFHIAISAVLMGLLAACATPPAPQSKDETEAALDVVLARKRVDKPVGPETAVAKPVYSEQSNTVSFLGDASVLLNSAAKGLGDGWGFEVGGPAPHLPIYVQVHAQNQSLQTFLQGVAEQLGQRADIELNGKKIRLVYRAH